MSPTENVPEKDQNRNDKRLRISGVKIVKNSFVMVEQSGDFHCRQHFRIIIMTYYTSTIRLSLLQLGTHGRKPAKGCHHCQQF
jgi:hypothetical protein